METNRTHRYTFRVTRPANNNGLAIPVTFDVEIDADTHAAGLNAILELEPSGSKAHMVDVRPGDDRCGDDRCAVCYPSSRNARTL